MCDFLVFLIAGLAATTVATAVAVADPTVYDQRQSGKTNVRVEVKDAVIIAVGDGEFGGDYDYSYDYSDLTVKPGQPISSTAIPSASTSPPNRPTMPATTPLVPATSVNVTQNAAAVLLEAENNSIIFPSVKPGNGSSSSSSSEPVKIPSTPHKPDQIPVLVLHEIHKPNNKFLPVKTVEKHYVPSSRIRGKVSNGTAIDPEELPARRCSPGFFLDDHNRCKRIRRPTRERPQLPIGFRSEGEVRRRS